LRLEAGMCLYGTDMDDGITPFETGLKWTVAWKPLERDFMGRAALAQQKADGIPRQLVGLVLQDKGVLRGHQKVSVEGLGDGEITSGTFSPTLGFSIALARIPAGKASHAVVHVRNKQLKAKIVKPVFVRNGKALVNQD
jgi:aminomethyltransferase